MKMFFFFCLNLFLSFSGFLEAKKTVGIFTFTYGVDAWDPDSVQSGIPGSEEAVIYLSNHLADLGYRVVVFGNPPKNSKYSQTEANPCYVSWDHALESPLDIGVVWRTVQAGPQLKKMAHKLYLWPHDVLNPYEQVSLEQIEAFEDVLWLSEWQRQDWISKNPHFARFHQIFGNGVEPSQFPSLAAKENPYSCIYASNYARGLKHLLDMWPEVKSRFPQATLDIYYGWKHWGNLTPEEESALRKKVKELEPYSVKEHGMVGHQELAQAFQKASFWTYPCTAEETFCITALKAQIAGAVPVICKNTGLIETCPNGFSCKSPQEYLNLLLKALESVEQISLEQRGQIRNFVLEMFTWRKIAESWKALFEFSRQKICLYMRVKDQQETIQKSLLNLRDKIHYWVVEDLGSCDGSIEKVREILKNVPGEVVPYQKNQALAVARNQGDYILFIDPKEELFFSDFFSFPRLEKDGYFTVPSGRKTLVKSSLNWQVQEGALVSNAAESFAVLPGVVSSLALQEPLSLSLARTHIEGKEYLAAKSLISSLLNRPQEEEICYKVFYYKGILGELLKEPEESILESYSRAYSFSPERAEPLFRMGVFSLQRGKYALAYSWIKNALSLPPFQGKDKEDWIYDYGIAWALGRCCMGLQKTQEAKSFYEKALSFPRLSSETFKEITLDLEKAQEQGQLR